MTQAARVLVATILPANGWCGVQTHFNAIVRSLLDAGAAASIVEPHQVNALLRKFPGFVGRYLLPAVSPEHAALWNRYFSYVFLGMRLKRELQRLRGVPVTVYAQDALSARAALQLRRAGYSFRLVMVAHFNVSEADEQVAHGHTAFGGPLYRRLMADDRAALPHVDALIFVSEYMSRQVNNRLPEIAALPQFVIPNFITPGDSTAEVDVSGDIVSIGTLEPRKNQGFLLQVLAEAARKGKRYSLTLVGDGASRATFEAMAAALGISPQVRFIGNQPNAARFLAPHRVYAHAATMEAFGIVLVEAMAAGRPILAAPVGGIPEVFTDGVEGVYWNLDDPAGAADQLIAVLDSPPVWSRMAQSALCTFRARLSVDVVAPRWHQVLLPTLQYGTSP
jgi:glycosyltransferase involved in cell wall biosynthesis